jgi:hypothetical protein
LLPGDLEYRMPSPRAVYLREAEVTDAAGNSKQVLQPYGDPEHWAGCGACEFAGPVRDRLAVYFTSAGGSQSKTNQILLQHSAKRTSWFPETGEVPGWTKTGKTRTFEAADLWKYIDGDAERYLRAGVRRTLTADYRYKETVEAVADIYLMGSPAGARKIFDSESSAGSHPVAIGDAAKSYGQSLTFRRGPFLVRLVAFQDTPQTEQSLVSLARGIEARLAR